MSRALGGARSLARGHARAADGDGGGRRALAASARELACGAVVVLPPLVATARAELGRGPVRVVAAVGLPFGAEGAAATAASCAQAVADGADVLDVVVSLPLLANGDFPARARRARGRRRRGRRRRARGAPHRRARGDRDVLPGARGLAPGGAAGAGRRLRRRRLRHRARPRGRDAGGDRGAARRAVAGRRRQGAGRHPRARRCAARARRGRRPARRRRSGEPARRARRRRRPPDGAVRRRGRLRAVGDLPSWAAWLLVALVLLGAEALTLQFVLVYFGLGALVATAALAVRRHRGAGPRVRRQLGAADGADAASPDRVVGPPARRDHERRDGHGPLGGRHDRRRQPRQQRAGAGRLGVLDGAHAERRRSADRRPASIVRIESVAGVTVRVVPREAARPPSRSHRSTNERRADRRRDRGRARDRRAAEDGAHRPAGVRRRGRATRPLQPHAAGGPARAAAVPRSPAPVRRHARAGRDVPAAAGDHRGQRDDLDRRRHLLPDHRRDARDLRGGRISSSRWSSSRSRPCAT